MPSAPLVSVIVPCYNAGEYIDEALQSLRRQTLEDIEVLVIDDASDDDSVARIRHHADEDRRVRLISLETRTGSASGPRNRGIEQARGEYVAFLDADDIALSHRLETTIRAMVAQKADIAFADFIKFSGPSSAQLSGGFLRAAGYLNRAGTRFRAAGNATWVTDDTLLGFMIGDMIGLNVQTFVALRAAFSNVGVPFDETLVGGEDIDLFIRLLKGRRLVYVDEVLTLFRVYDGSLSARRRTRCIRDAIEVRRRHMMKAQAEISNVELQQIRATLAHQYTDLAYGSWLGGHAKEAREAYREAWSLGASAHVALAYAKTFARRDALVRVRDWFA